MADLKNTWTNTGAGLGHAFRDLGKTIIVSGKEGVDKAVDWAESDPNANTPPQGYAAQPSPYQPGGAANPQPQQAPAYTAPDPQPAQQASPAKFTADEIRKLAQLRDEGLITDEEFIAKKKQLLGI